MPMSKVFRKGNWLYRALRRKLSLLGQPRGSIAALRPDRPHLHQQHQREDDSQGLVSQLCRYGTLDSPRFRQWIQQLREPWRAHRKLWELAYISQALEERDMLRSGRRGLGFAVGAEKLPSFFAARGCTIVATDLPAHDERRIPWASTGQWVGARDLLNAHGICEPRAFADRVSFRAVDMNVLPGDLLGFDFTWSTRSFEHCGSLALGLRFLERQMNCLRPGGVAVHTTEFNLTSNRATIDSGPCVIYRLKDIEAVCGRLVDAGHAVAPLDIHVGSHALDRHVDEPPYPDWVKHLRLRLEDYASTSIGLIITKAG
jgi:hypothetical protein